jgi:copper homeostasis protein
MKRNLLLEISVESLEAAVAAERGGANRIELCEALRAGGVTPNAKLMRAARASVKIPIFIMIRPRDGNFVFSGAEADQMKSEIETARVSGMDGIVLGILREDATVDVPRTRELVQFARPLPVTFHRAFDECPDLPRALEDVIETGATRILTSGGKPSAAEGAAALATLVNAARGRITILPGGGINPSNLRRVVRATRATEFHSGLGSSLPYPRNGHSQFEQQVRRLAQILTRPEPEPADTNP